MIIQIKVANYRSIGPEQTLSFVAENTRRHPDNLIPRKGYKLLKAAALFGANASGKSNFVKAIEVMQEFVCNSDTRMNVGDLIEAAEPFRLDSELRVSPSRFEITFVTDKILYIYGFAVRRERVEEEWLRAKQEATETKVCEFQRKFNPVSEEYDWSFEGFEEADKKQIRGRTLENMLALSVGTQQKVEMLQPAYSYIRRDITTFDMSRQVSLLSALTTRLCEKDDFMRQILASLLQSADTGIDNFRIENTTRSALNIPNFGPDIPDFAKSFVTALKDFAASVPTPNIVLERHDNAGNILDFDFGDDESQGTQRLFAVAGPIFNALQGGAFVAIDELDASMHPLLTRRLLELFQSAAANKNGAQLLFTTHDSSLLDQDLLRRDQIWLAEKCDGASTFFSLADIQPPIRNTESFLRNYLVGRYGGTPHLGRAFDDLIAGVRA